MNRKLIPAEIDGNPSMNLAFDMFRRGCHCYGWEKLARIKSLPLFLMNIIEIVNLIFQKLAEIHNWFTQKGVFGHLFGHFIDLFSLTDR